MRTARCLFKIWYRPFAFLAALLVVQQALAVDFMFRANVDGETFEGKPLAWTDNSMYLLGRDGRLHSFHPKEAKEAVKTSPNFVGYSVPELKQELYREFGDSLDITTTQHYIVAHPHGARSDWADRFEELYRSCLAYFRVRGFQPEEPKFPLVAIVYPNREDYYRAAAAKGKNFPPGMLGRYDPDSNRVYLFDVTAGKPNGDWSENASTIIHEATHQTAFNVGIHNRFADQPRWLVEGLATMFEARGIWDSQANLTPKDRINQGRLAEFRTGLAKRQPGRFAGLIASDQLFKTDVTAAYSEAWAMVLFLCETRPRELAQYLEKTADRADFSNYFAAQRVADFAECFGSDLNQLEADFLNWMAQLR